MIFSAITSMYLNGSGATAAYLGYAKVWPTGSSETYTFVDGIWADVSPDKDLMLGTQLNLSDFTIRFKATTRKYTGGTIVGSSPTRFFVLSATAAYWDVNGERNGRRMTVDATQYGLASGMTYDLVLKNHSLYNLTINSGATGTTVTDTGYTGDMKIRISTVIAYEIEVMDGNVVTGHYLPAKRDSDGLYGLYDTITDTFYTSTDYTIYGGAPI